MSINKSVFIWNLILPGGKITLLLSEFRWISCGALGNFIFTNILVISLSINLTPVCMCLFECMYECLPECTSSNSMAQLDSNLIPKILIPPRIKVRTHPLGNGAFQFCSENRDILYENERYFAVLRHNRKLRGSNCNVILYSGPRVWVSERESGKTKASKMCVLWF